MKSAVIGASIASNLTGESQQFTVRQNAKMIWGLIDGLYSDKISTPIRELWTNAHDSHTEAGIPDVPFTCQLPSMLNPTFTVRDFGTSLSHEQVMHLYTTLGDSTRDEGENADDFVGCFGLGSKSPFAYTDSFTVTTWLDGIKRFYLAAKDASGMPALTFLGEEKSDELTGLEVSFPVEARHFSDFKNKALAIAQGFDVPPTIEGVDYSFGEPILSGLGWRLYEGRENSVRQGCVIYPVDRYSLRLDLPFNFNHGLVVDVPIGHVQVALNREALALDEVTVANASAAFKAAAQEVVDTAVYYVESAADLFEAEKRWVSVKDVITTMPSITFNGTLLNGKITFSHLQKNTPNLYGWDQKKVGGYKDSDYHFAIQNTETLKFVIDRTDQKIERKVLRFRSYRASYSRSQLYVLKNPTSQQLATLVRRLHLRPDQLVPFSKLPDPGPTSRGPRGKSTHVPGVYTATGSRYGYKVDKYATVEQMDKNYIWVPIERVSSNVSFSLGGQWFGQQSITDVNDHLEAAFKTTGEKRTVYYMTAGARERFKVEESHRFDNVIKAWCDKNRVATLANEFLASVVGSLRNNSRTHLSELVVNKLCEDLHPAASSCPTIDGRSRFINALFSEALRLASESGSLAALAIQEQYPLLFHDGDDTDILDYIQSKKG